MQRSRKGTSQSYAISTALTPTIRQLKIAQMQELALECGFICQALTEYQNELATAISVRLTHRMGKNVYQSVSFTIPLFAREAALEIFGSTRQTANHMNWKVRHLPLVQTHRHARGWYE